VHVLEQLVAADLATARADAAGAGVGVALVTVLDTSGSTPRHAGARMAVAADGRRWGTIGGGRIEHEAEQAARLVAAGAPAQRIRHHLVRDLAMCCGGAMELVIAPLAPSWSAVQAAVAVIGAAADADGPAVLETPADGGPLRVRRLGVDERAPRSARFDGEVLRERVEPRPRALVFGAGHVGSALGPLCQALGFQVVACDDGDTGALEPAPAWADLVIESFAVADVERVLGRLGRRDHALIVTRDHAVDQRILEELLGRAELGYLGMIGSRGKLGRFRKRLAAKGIGAEADWARLRAPVGLDVGAESPAEIAVAIAAQLIAVRRRGQASAGAWAAAPAVEA
jgi:xanthine dehydrogenase accessory factor